MSLLIAVLKNFYMSALFIVHPCYILFCHFNDITECHKFFLNGFGGESSLILDDRFGLIAVHIFGICTAETYNDTAVVSFKLIGQHRLVISVPCVGIIGEIKLFPELSKVLAVGGKALDFFQARDAVS